MRWSRKRASSPDFTPHITSSSYPTCFPHISPLFPLPCTSWKCRELFLCFFILCKQSQPPLSLPAPGSSTPLKISLVQNLQTYKIHLFFFPPISQTLLKKDGHVEMEPLSFCSAKRPDSDRLLVVIRNEDISSHIHKVRPETALFIFFF